MDHYNQQLPQEQPSVEQQPVIQTPPQTMPSQPSPKSKLLLFIIAFIFLILIGGGGYLLGARNNNIKQTLVQPSISPSVTTTTTTQVDKYNLGLDKIAFVKNKKLFLLDRNGIKQLAENVSISDLKWSQDGSVITWIDTNTFPYADNPKQSFEVNYSISQLDLSTGIVKKIIQPNISDAEYKMSRVDGEKPLPKNILHGFDYLKGDSKKIVYSSNGAWIKDLTTNTSEQILKDGDYGSVYSYPLSDYLLICASPFCEPIIYDLNTKTELPLTESSYPNISYPFVWSNDGKSIIIYSASRAGSPGLWIYDLINKKQTEITPDKDSSPGFPAAALSKDNKLIAAIDPFLKQASKLPTKNLAIYLVSADGTTKLIYQPILNETTTNNYIYHLDWINNGSGIAYLLCNGGQMKSLANPVSYSNCDVREINADGTNDQILLEGIDLYRVWNK